MVAVSASTGRRRGPAGRSASHRSGIRFRSGVGWGAAADTDGGASQPPVGAIVTLSAPLGLRRRTGRSAQIPAQQIQQLTGGTMARQPFPDQSCCKADHGHPTIERLHSGQGIGIPGPAGGQTLSETLDWFVLKGGFRHHRCART